MQVKRAENLATQVAIGWGLMLVTFALMLTVMVMDNIFANNDFHALRRDPGPGFMPLLLYIFGVYAMMPIYVFIVARSRLKIFRWIALAIAVWFFLFFFMHHLSHWQHGDRPTIASHVIDSMLDVYGVWVIVNSIRWALVQEPETQTATAAVPSL